MERLTGLVAATFTPMKSDGALNLDPVKPIVDHLVSSGVSGLYVCGSTGEGPLLSTAERKTVLEAYVDAAAGRLPVVVQVGHNSIAEAKGLAEHAQACGVDAISALPPMYFKPETLDALIACLAEIAQAAPDTPFYYYNIPPRSGVTFNMLDFLRAAPERIPLLAGVKYSDRTVEEFQACLQFDGGRFDVLFGVDQMLLSALAVGAKGAIGSTYNFGAPLHRKTIAASNARHLDEAREHQAFMSEAIRLMLRFGSLASLKAVMGMIGFDCGPCRLPIATLSEADAAALQSDLERLGFFKRLEECAAAAADPAGDMV